VRHGYALADVGGHGAFALQHRVDVLGVDGAGRDESGAGLADRVVDVGRRGVEHDG
jgi:hypothetical protein